MKYLQYFKENSSNIVYNSDNYEIIKNGNIYEVLDKNEEEKYFLNFNNGDFSDENESQIYLKEFFEEHSELFNFFGEIVPCKNVIIKDGNDWWLMIDDNDWFADYIKLDSRTRDDFAKKVLAGDGIEIFSYDYRDFDIDEDFDLDKDNLMLMKIVLYLEKEINNYDYDIEDVKDYSDVVDIVKEYDISALKKILQISIRSAHESADSDDAYNDLLDSAYDHFGLVDKTAKWQTVEGYKYQQLFIKFKSPDSAYFAKFLIMNYDDSYSDDMVKYWGKDYYSGDREVMQEIFDNELSDRISDYDRFSEDIKYDEISDLDEIYKELKKENPQITEEEIFKEFDIKISAKKYNL